MQRQVCELTWRSYCHQPHSSVCWTMCNNSTRRCPRSSVGSHCTSAQRLAPRYCRAFRLTGNNFVENMTGEKGEMEGQGRVEDEGEMEGQVRAEEKGG